ncbi:MAG TPA: PAS domain-containing protein, partial [Streptosporangiaceae bacterium]|nr:PAS domain-containing protein [Streptosporangiaceae bacterium]
MHLAPVPAVSPEMMSPDMMSPGTATPATARPNGAARPEVAGPADAASPAAASTDASVPQPRLSELDTADAALLETLLREAPIGFALFGPDLCFRRVNQTLARMHERDPEEHIGRTPADVWPADFGARAESAGRRVLSEGQPVFESEQGARWALSWFPCRDAHGEVGGVVLIAVDVAGRSREGQGQPEETIRRSEERYRSLVQGAAQVVWVADAGGDIIEDCPEWRFVTGQTSEQYLGRGWLDAIHPEDRDRVERDGKIVEWVGASTDVTGQREAEEMRGRLTEQLSAAALRTARLQQATSMLAEALTVEQVVEVITEVGRTAIGAQRSAVALL